MLLYQERFKRKVGQIVWTLETPGTAQGIPGASEGCWVDSELKYENMEVPQR